MFHLLSVHYAELLLPLVVKGLALHDVNCLNFDRYLCYSMCYRYIMFSSRVVIGNECKVDYAVYDILGIISPHSHTQSILTSCTL